MNRVIFVFSFLFLYLNFSFSSVEVIYPEYIIEGVSYDVEVSSEDELGDLILVNNQELVLETDENKSYFVFEFGEKEIQTINGQVVNPYKGQVIPLWMSILPPLIAIILALIFKEVVFSLVSGIFIGGAVMGVYSHGIQGFFTGFLRVIDTYILNALYNSDHISIIVFSIIIGGIVALISRNGGMQGIVNKIVKRATNARSGQMATWFLGVAIFFDDYANTLVVGNTMRPITDRLKISREKLSYIVDSTAAPVAAIAFVTTWIGAELGYISSGINKINANGIEVKEGVYSIFLNSLQYSFYPILTLLFMLYIIWRQKDFGPMLKAEKRARSGEVVNSEVNDADLTEIEDLEPVEGIKYRAFNAIIPVGIIVFGTLIGLLFTGFDSIQSELLSVNPRYKSLSWAEMWAKMGELDLPANSFSQKLGTLIGSANSYIALLWSSLTALFVAIILTISQKIMNLKDSVETVVSGFKTMMPAILILILAWALAIVTEDMHTADFLTTLISGNISPYFIPAFTFILAGFVAFSTGSSWSTMALVYPLILPAAWQVCMHSGYESAEAMAIFYNVVSAVLAGSVLGDHCSPISDTTILSSLASGCNHIDHVRSQIPYALTVGGVSVVCGTLLSAIGLNPILSFIISFAILIVVVEVFGKKVSENG